MTTHMWSHPLTYRHLRVLAEIGYNIVPPVEKILACGDTGIKVPFLKCTLPTRPPSLIVAMRPVGVGALAEISTISAHVNLSVLASVIGVPRRLGTKYSRPIPRPV